MNPDELGYFTNPKSTKVTLARANLNLDWKPTPWIYVVTPQSMHDMETYYVETLYLLFRS